jgi:hypothetical protein
MTYLALGLEIAAAVGSAATAYSGIKSGQAIQAEDKMKARQAGLDATAKQIQIRQNMMQALASQNARAGANGQGTGGSFGATVQRQITENQNDLLTNSTNASTQSQLFNEQGNSAAQTGYLQAGASLLDFAGSNTGKTIASQIAGTGS